LKIGTIPKFGHTAPWDDAQARALPSEPLHGFVISGEQILCDLGRAGHAVLDPILQRLRHRHVFS
jgi:hypothetical protein